MQPFNKRIKKGDPAAFVELYDQLGEPIYRYVFARVGSSQDASDVVQDIFVRLVKSHRSLAKAENFKSYIFAVARTETIRWFESKKRTSTEPLLSENHDGGESAAERTRTIAEELESDDWVNHVLVSLGEVDREIVQLKVFSQLTFKEIANVMQMQPSNVATKYRRAIVKLESQLSNNQSKLGLKP